MLRTHQFRSDQRPVSRSLSVAAVVVTNTKEAAPTEIRVPMPTLVFGLSSTGPITFGRLASIQPAIPQKRPTAADQDDVLDTSKHPPADKAEAEDSAPPIAAAEFTAPSPFKTERSLSDAEREDEAQEDRDAEETEAGLESSFRSSPISHAIELTIDSLSHLELTQAITVMVNPLGERIFTATVDALSLSSTGETLTDALIGVKEQIEQLYEKLTKITEPDEIQKDQLNYLRSHIKSTDEPAKHKRGIWR